jgi:lysophospholipase L1-like esterase
VSSPWGFLRGYSIDGPVQPGSRIPEAYARQLPEDTVAAALVPAGIRLELIGTATSLVLGFEQGDLAMRHAPTMGDTFSVWVGDRHQAQIPVPTGGIVTVPLPARAPEDVVTVYLPDVAPISVTFVTGQGGTAVPAPRQPKWVVYGDSIAQGWSATDPGSTWPAIVGRELDLDPVNLGFAGAARGESASAAQVADTPAEVITLAWGTNCWSMVPFDEQQMADTTETFLHVVRTAQPGVPILVMSPIARPQVEQTPNVRGATLARLRSAAEATVRRIALQDNRIRLLSGADLIPGDLLVDGIHPGDKGHQLLAEATAAALGALRTQTPG